MKASYLTVFGFWVCAVAFLSCAPGQTAPLPAAAGQAAQEKAPVKSPDSTKPDSANADSKGPDSKSADSKSADSRNAESAATTFHAESRLVVLDVVVTGAHRQPVTGLTQADFTLLEDGKPQQILFFEAHVPPSGSALRAQPPIPANQYTNVSEQAPSSINIVLFDALNTPLTDQPYAREQMLQWLRTLPGGQQLALFELGSRLRMIAGFTTKSEDLVAAAKKTVVHHSEMLDSRDERQDDEAQLGLMREGSPNQGFFDAFQKFMEDNWAARDQNRAYATLQAFADLAHAVSGFRGRKNVIWLAEEFPVYFGPEINPDDPHPNIHSYADLTRETAGKLSASQMSIYPIDVRGLAPLTGAAASAGGPPRRNGVMEVENLHISMDELAKQTGGRAYYNTNDLRLAMQRSLENGSHYYTIAYTPQNREWNSRYRQVKIRLAQPGLEAEYRRGYFATPEKPPSEDESHAELVRAIQPASPQSTMITLRAQVVPPDAGHANVRIDFTVDAAGLVFTDAPLNRKDAKLEIVAVAWDKSLKEAMNSSHRVELDLPPDRYDSIMRNGLSGHQELKLQPGSYIVRVGVMDDGSQKIGTLDLPVEVVGAGKVGAK